MVKTCLKCSRRIKDELGFPWQQNKNGKHLRFWDSKQAGRRAHLDVDRSRSGAELPPPLLLGWRRSRSSRLLSEGEPLWSLLPGERDLDKRWR